MDDLDEMLDHYRIVRLVAEYCHGCDRAQRVLMASVYAKDSVDLHGAYQGSGQEFAKIVVRERQDRGHSMRHQLRQTLVAFKGDTAGAETYFTATVTYRNEIGDVWIDQLGGRYVDEVCREDGHWKIRKRLVVRDWSNSLPVENDELIKCEFEAGTTDSSDHGVLVDRT